jgi:hypothetical protein
MFQIQFLCDVCYIKWEQWYIFHSKWVTNFQSENKLHFDETKIMSFCTRPTRWVGLHSTSPPVNMSLHSETLSLFLLPNFAFYSLMMCAEQRNNTHQCYSFWFDLAGARTHDLPHWGFVYYANNFIFVYTMCYMYYMPHASTVSNYFVFQEFRDE